MRKSDFSPEKLDQLIVAFADDELEGEQKKFIGDLVSSDPEVKQRFLEFQNSGKMLQAFFDVEKVSAPDDVKHKIMNYAIASKPNKTISFPQKIKQAVNNNFRVQNLTQIAAALVIGAFFGPSLFQSFVQDPVAGDKISITLRGSNQNAAISPVKTEEVISILVKTTSGTFDLPVEAGGTIEENQSFIIQLKSPIEGKIIVFEEIDGSPDNSSDSLEKNILFEGRMLSGQTLRLPREGAFTLSDQKSFNLVSEFSNSAEKMYFRSVYTVK